MKIITEYYEQLHANKLDNLEKLEKFLETYNLPRLTQEEINNLNRSIISCETESVIKKVPENKNTELNGFREKLYQTYKEKVMSAPIKLFQKKKKEKGTLPIL